MPKPPQPPAGSEDAARVLLVEDSNFFGSIVSSRLEAHPLFDVVWAKDGEAAVEAIEESPSPFAVAVCDLNLPDSPRGEIVDAVLARGLPVVVLTGQVDDDMRDRMWSHKVVDYIVKEGAQAIDYLVDLLERFLRNPSTRVLVVDDSSVSRAYVCDLLRVQRYSVLEAADGASALQTLATHGDVQLLITDFNMPDMNGADLVKEVRRERKRHQLAIMGVSAYGSGRLSARLIKAGANDFLYRPFVAEEFYCRVTENIRALEHLRSLDDLANRDFLTGLHNRRYFFDVGSKLWENVQRGNLQLLTAMVDIDHFKVVNDTYGHEAGDVVLQGVAAAFARRFRKADVVARLGGEEFCVLAANMGRADAERVFNEVRQYVGNIVHEHDEARIQVNVSIGLVMGCADSFGATLARADALLYEAKESGRNRVVCG